MKWRAWGRRALLVLAVLLVAVTLLPLWTTDRWWVRQWDYPRIQVAAALAIVLLLLFWARFDRGKAFWTFAVALVAALVWQGLHFFAYLPGYPKEVQSVERCPPGRSLTLVNANVLMTNDHYGDVLSMVARRRPDVVLLLEPGPEWAKALAPLARAYPYRLVDPIPDTYGMILLSKLPMTGKIGYRLQAGVPSATVALTLRGGEQVMLYALHPEPPWPGDDSGERDAELVSVGRDVRANGRASIVMGDLNDVAWSRTSRLFKDVSGMKDPRVGRGFYPTFNAKYPLLRWPLDHLFVTPHFKVTALDVLPSIHSDHFPIAFDLCLVQPAGRRLVARSAPNATEREASEEVREGVEEEREEEHGQ